jgi:predicted TIM-barrel fold metal-dependent hydrolase
MTDTITRTLYATDSDILAEFAAKINGFDANFAAFDTAGVCILDLPVGRFESDMDQLAQYAALTCQQQSDDVQRFGTNDEVLALCLKVHDETVGAIVIDTPDVNLADNEDLRRFCSQHAIDYVLLEKFIQRDRGDRDYFREILRLFARQFKATLKRSALSCHERTKSLRCSTI